MKAPLTPMVAHAAGPFVIEATVTRVSMRGRRRRRRRRRRRSHRRDETCRSIVEKEPSRRNSRKCRRQQCGGRNWSGHY